MGVYLFNTDGVEVFFKNPMKSNEMIAAGYTVEAPTEKPLTKPQVVAVLTDMGVEFDKTAGVAVLRGLLADIYADTDPE